MQEPTNRAARDAMHTVSFVHMTDGTREEYEFLEAQLAANADAGIASRLLEELERLRGPTLGYKVDRYARDAYRGHAFYDDCVRFCERYDQTSFDPDYDTLPIEHFEPMVRRVFARTPWRGASAT